MEELKKIELSQEAIELLKFAVNEQRLVSALLNEADKSVKMQTLLNYLDSL